LDIFIVGIDGEDSAKFHEGSGPIANFSGGNTALVTNGEGCGGGSGCKLGGGFGSGVDGGGLSNARGFGSGGDGGGGGGCDGGGNGGGSRLGGEFAVALLAV
jgi:hypothetical protein